MNYYTIEKERSQFVVYENSVRSVHTAETFGDASRWVVGNADVWAVGVPGWIPGDAR
jgi:hypothetical protein